MVGGAWRLACAAHAHVWNTVNTHVWNASLPLHPHPFQPWSLTGHHAPPPPSAPRGPHAQVPWSQKTRKGMPEEYEKLYYSSPAHAIINVPPTFMFKAKIFKPSRLCAIYELVAPSSEAATPAAAQ
jgi:hypothetical protein